MRAQALLQRNRMPARPEIRAGLNRNLCRCGTHMRILRAVRRAAAACRRRVREAADDAMRPCSRAARCWPAPARWSSAFRSRRPGSRRKPPASSAAPRRAAPPLPGSLKQAPLARCLDPHRRRRRDHRLHRQGRARPGHQDRAASRSPPRSSTSMPARINLVTADTGADPERGLHRRQPFDAGQRHRDPQRRRAGAAAAGRRRRRRAAASGRAADRRESGVVARRTAAARLRRTGCRRSCCTSQRDAAAPLKDPASFSVIGTAMPRVDIPAKVTGGAAYVQDMRLPRHAARARRAAAELRRQLAGVDDRRGVENLPGS